MMPIRAGSSARTDLNSGEKILAKQSLNSNLKIWVFPSVIGQKLAPFGRFLGRPPVISDKLRHPAHSPRAAIRGSRDRRLDRLAHPWR